MKNIPFLFILFNQVLFAQIKQKEYYPVYINYPEYTVKTNIVPQNKKINIDRSITYFWYSSNKIQETMGGVDGKMLHGQYSSFYLNGNLKEKGIFKAGVKNGEWTTWYENGKIKEIITWKKGIRSKIALYYNDEGELASSTGYKNGKLHGYQVHYKNGAVQEKKKYKNGNEVTKKIKKKTKNENNASGRKTHFSEKSKIFTARIKSGISKLKTNRSKEHKQNEEIKEKKKKNSPLETPNKKQQDKDALSLKNKGASAKKAHTKSSRQ